MYIQTITVLIFLTLFTMLGADKIFIASPWSQVQELSDLSQPTAIINKYNDTY